MMSYSTQRDGYGRGRLSPPQPAEPNPRRLVDGYTKDVMNNFASDAPRFNPLNSERTESSPLVDLQDPIQVHLLTETALTDSKTYEILSQEEVDDLKKQIQLLSQRIQQARTNLIIQTKYRDAAISMSKLYTPGKQDSSRRRSLLNRNSGGESAREAERERQAIEKKCEELASELWSLEKRLMEPQRRLLEHTAGILQLTHKTPKKAGPANVGPPLNGIPGSPESMYTFNNDRNSLDPDEVYMDDQSLFQSLNGGQVARSGPQIPMEPPLKSPHREQSTQLREEAERLREENRQLKAQVQDLNLNVDSLRRGDTGRLQTIVGTEQRLESLNQALRSVIVALDPTKNSTYQSPPKGPSQTTQPGGTVDMQFEYLEQGLRLIGETRETQSSGGLREAEAAAASASIALTRAEIRLDSLNAQFRELLLSADPDYPNAPDASGAELEEQFDYSDQSLRLLESELNRALEANASRALKRRDDDQSEAVLMGLWDIIQSGYADIRDRKEQRRRMRSEQGLEPDEDDMSGDEGVDLNETYSLPAFSTRVQWLYAQATKLKDQKSVLKRQIKQQRELNNKSDSAKDAELQSKQEEIEQIRDMLAKSEQESLKAQGMLSQALKDAEDATANRSVNDANVARAQEQLQERDAKIMALETESRSLQQRMMDVTTSVEAMEGRVNQADEEVNTLTAKLADAEKLAAEKEKEAADASARAKEQEEELDALNVTLVEVKTELTFCKAELDGAYGSRKERAVEAAAIKSSAEVDQLKSEVERLKNELAETLKELEGITAETISAEREKLDVEGRLDDALASRAGLELEITNLRDQLDAEMRGARDKMAKLLEELDAERLKVVPGSAGGSRPGAGASMLSEQFRATMKQERRKFQEDLREEQAKRRKLEEEIQRLRKAQGPGKSPLSPR